jgi:hypothetical protein
LCVQLNPADERHVDPISLMLFYIPMEVVTALVSHVVEEQVFSPLSGISDLQRLVSRAVEEPSFQFIVRAFTPSETFCICRRCGFVCKANKASGLKIKYKSAATLIRGETQDEHLVKEIENFPIKYLGL